MFQFLNIRYNHGENKILSLIFLLTVRHKEVYWVCFKAQITNRLNSTHATHVRWNTLYFVIFLTNQFGIFFFSLRNGF